MAVNPATGMARSLYHLFQQDLTRKYLVQGILLVALLLWNLPGFSFQNAAKIDSLQALVETATDTTRINLLNELGRQYWMSQVDTARLYAQDALMESRQIHYKKGEAEALRIVGWSYQYQGNKTEGKDYVEQAIQIFEQIGYEQGMAAALNNLGNIYTSRGDYAEGIQSFQRSLALFRTLGNLEGEGSVLNYMGQNYRYQGNYDKAIDYYLQGLAIRQKIQDHSGIAYSLNNIGNMYLLADKLNSALEYYHQSMTYAQERGGLPSLEYSLLLLGQTYNCLGQYDTALFYLNKSLAINPKNGDALNTMGAVYLAMQAYEASLLHLLKCLSLLEKHHTRTTLHLDVLNNMSKVYMAQQRYPEALAYAQQSFAISREIGAQGGIKAAAQTLSEIYAGLHDFARAYEYLQLYITLKDSIVSEEYTSRLAMLETNLDLAEKQADIDALTQQQQLQQQELKRQATLRNVFLAGLSFTLILSLVIFRNINLKRKADRLLKERLESDLELERLEKKQKEAAFQSRAAELEMMALRAQMNPHFIFNCLNSINRFILKNQPEEASDYLTKFSKLIRLILQNSQSKTVSLESELEALHLYVEMEVLRFEGHFDYQIRFAPDIEMEELEVPPLIIQPYVENAIWHGLMHKEEKGHLLIEMYWENNTLYCLITDDGIGRQRAAELKSKSARKKKSLGMQITAHRLELMNALNDKASTVEVTDLVDVSGTACGTRVLLKIPLYQSDNCYSTPMGLR